MAARLSAVSTHSTPELHGCTAVCCLILRVARVTALQRKYGLRSIERNAAMLYAERLYRFGSNDSLQSATRTVGRGPERGQGRGRRQGHGRGPLSPCCSIPTTVSKCCTPTKTRCAGTRVSSMVYCMLHIVFQWLTHRIATARYTMASYKRKEENKQSRDRHYTLLTQWHLHSALALDPADLQPVPTDCGVLSLWVLRSTVALLHSVYSVNQSLRPSVTVGCTAVSTHLPCPS
jgi:hypothetical protein